MRILFLTQYFPPETGAAQSRLWNLAQRLASHGHTVTVVTALPSYPTGRIFEEYRGKVVREAMEGPVRVIRSWCYVTKSNRLIPRLLNYFSFVISSLLFAGWKVSSQDFVIVESPPLFLGISGFVLSRMKRARMVMNVSDLWPESALALGVIKEGALLRWTIKFEEYLYRKSVLITGQTQGIVKNIGRRIPDKQIVFLPNGVSPENILNQQQRSDARRETRQRFNVSGQFVVGYAGLHGLAQALDTILDAAKRVERESRILFLLVGDGPEKERLISGARDRGLANVRFLPPQSAADMPKVLGSFDVAIVPLRRHPLFQGALPSKLFEAMGAGLPVIFSGKGEGCELVQRALAGICVEPQNPTAMADAIIKLFGDPELCLSYGNNAVQYVLKNFNRAEIAAKLSSILTGTSSASAVGDVPDNMQKKSATSAVADD